MVHEIVEAVLCRHRGISEEAVTAFDMDFAGDGEPGDAPDSPYKKEHRFATVVERLLASELGLDWDEYERAIAALSEGR